MKLSDIVLAVTLGNCLFELWLFLIDILSIFLDNLIYFIKEKRRNHDKKCN